MDTTTTMPAIFVGHGSPMNALEQNRWTRSWAEFAQRIAKPKAILAISAHWYISATAVTAMAAPPTIHDFYGFPDKLFAVDYPAAGAPELAATVAETVSPTWVGLDVDSWGIDHGSWSVLTHMYPEADIPVVQLSIDATKPPEYHVALGAALAPLRQQGVLIVASGNVVHNLGMLDWGSPESGLDWAVDYNETATQLMTERPGDITQLLTHPSHHLAAPSAEHLLPLFYLAGLAQAAGTGTDVLVDGYAMGSLSMTSHVLGASLADPPAWT